MTDSSHNFHQDPSGLWHHESRELGSVYEAANEASEHLAGRVAWFWWCGTFSPILPGDTADTLERRWSTWRQRFQADNSNTLRDLIQFCKKH
jgi:hypothetical protein